jgi:dTDP-4-amino-4,6-dideoxygalactose transaminase
MIKVANPFFDRQEIEELKEVLNSGQWTEGSKTSEFEKIIADYVGVSEAVAVTSATTALYLSLYALGIKRKDEILVSDFTFPATANVVLHCGAKPILVDVKPDTFNLDVNDCKKKLTKDTKALIVVHALGQSCEMDEIIEFANEKDLLVIEDAACALGASYDSKMCGSFGIAGCFSFHPRKSISTGEGGMITTNDKELAAKMRLLRSHGGIREGYRSSFVIPGFNFKMSEFQAAVGIAQFKKLEKMLAAKKKIAEVYNKAFKDFDKIKIPKIAKKATHTYQSYTILLDKKVDRDEIINKLREKGVETTIGTYALHSQPFFKRHFGYRNGDLPNSYHIFKHSLTLPCYYGLKKKEIEYIISNVLQLMKFG